LCSKVYAFEANPVVAEKLKRNISLNNFEHLIEVNQWAVADKVGEVTFSLSSDSNSGWGHIGEDTRFEKIVTKTDTLDNFFEEKGLEKVDLMKVDIEGAEDMLIEGAKRILSEQRIKHIHMEFCKMTSESVKNRLLRLQDFGYFPDKQDERILERMRVNNNYSVKIVRNFTFHTSRD
jgi:FkbM family methyltransferase